MQRSFLDSFCSCLKKVLEFYLSILMSNESFRTSWPDVCECDHSWVFDGVRVLYLPNINEQRTGDQTNE